MISKIYELRREIEKLETQGEELGFKLGEVKDDLAYHERSRESLIDEAKDDAKTEFLEALEQKYEPAIETLENDIDKLKEKLEEDTIEEETEELKEKRLALDNRNKSAILLATLEAELVATTSQHFVSLAYTGESFTDEEFVDNLTKIEKTIKNVRNYRARADVPFGEAKEYLATDTTVASAIYFYSVVNAFKIVPQFVRFLLFSVKRAKYLNDIAIYYHKMMFALVRLQEKSDAEINELLNQLLQANRAELQKQLKGKEEELIALKERYEDEKSSFEFDDAEVVESYEAELENLKSEIEKLQAQINELELTIEDKNNQLVDLEETHQDSLAVRMNQFLKPRDERLVVIPDELMFSKTDETINYCQYPTALYMYEDLEDVTNFISLTTFQLRNVMEWGVIEFKVVDFLGGDFMRRFLLPTSEKSSKTDINLYTLSNDYNELIELTYDTLVRRRTQALSVINDIATYNLLQKEQDSATIPYIIVSIILTDPPKFSEKLLQMIHIGEKSGIIFHMYVKEEHIKLDMVKTIENKFNRFAELKYSGITYYHPSEIRERLVQEELEKKSRI